jgi:hypothetical protein
MLFMTWAYADKPEMTEQLAAEYIKAGQQIYRGFQVCVDEVGRAKGDTSTQCAGDSGGISGSNTKTWMSKTSDHGQRFRE